MKTCIYFHQNKNVTYIHFFTFFYITVCPLKFLKRFEFYEQKCFLKVVLNQLLSKAHKKQELGQTGNHFERANVWLTFC